MSFKSFFSNLLNYTPVDIYDFLLLGDSNTDTTSSTNNNEDKIENIYPSISVNMEKLKISVKSLNIML